MHSYSEYGATITLISISVRALLGYSGLICLKRIFCRGCSHQPQEPSRVRQQLVLRLPAVLLQGRPRDVRPTREISKRCPTGLLVVATLKCELEGCQLPVGEVVEQLLDRRQHTVGNLFLLDSRLREEFDVAVRMQVPKERLDVGLVERNNRVVLPDLAVDCRRLIQNACSAPPE